jgi:phosphomannomutase
MKTVYIFDVDGTMTEPRQKVTDEFANYFKKWSVGRDLYISTGSDFKKTKEQLGTELLMLFREIYCCMGNETRLPDETIIKQRDFVIPDALEVTLNNFLKESICPLKTGNHIELRTGMINFSTVGRNANKIERLNYNNWDKESKEREKIANYINLNFPLLEASVGGSISIDIIEKGRDKGQVVKHLIAAGVERIVFYGDKCSKGGNDYGIIRELEYSNIEYQWTNISGPDFLLNILKAESCRKEQKVSYLV